MSQDLFAAFGSAGEDVQKPASKPAVAFSSSFFDDLNAPPAINNQWNVASNSTSKPLVFRDNPEIQQNDEDWGDFEGVAGKATSPSAVPIAAQFSKWLDEEPEQSSKPTIKGPAFSTNSFGSSKVQTPKTVISPTVRANEKPVPVPRDPHVLFDAEEDEPDDDDFGDFEEPAEEPKPQIEEPDLLGLDFGPSEPVQAKTLPSTSWKQPTSSLLDLDSLSFDSPAPSKVPPKTTGPHYDLSSLGPVTSQLKSAPRNTPSPVTTKKSPDIPRRPVSIKPPKPQPEVKPQIEEPWDDFAAWDEEKAPKTKPANVSKSSIPPPLLSPAIDPGTNQLPPTNIPPPASLLSLFPPLFTSAETEFFRPTSSEPQNIRSRIFADPATITYLKGLLTLATVCGRIIAGRKNRWKRDAILAQSMRIGPAAAGGHSGLKLASVDKGETTKEDREAADVLRVWQALVGRLKAAIAEAKKANDQDLGPLPELRDVMPIRIAKEVEGGVPGFKACALCGLKREERVGKVDLDVMDSFGEWWIEGMNMHRGMFSLFSVLILKKNLLTCADMNLACRNFWEEQKDVLRQR
jgi:hypothetical protein